MARDHWRAWSALQDYHGERLPTHPGNQSELTEIMEKLIFELLEMVESDGVGLRHLDDAIHMRIGEIMGHSNEDEAAALEAVLQVKAYELLDSLRYDLTQAIAEIDGLKVRLDQGEVHDLEDVVEGLEEADRNLDVRIPDGEER